MKTKLLSICLLLLMSITALPMSIYAKETNAYEMNTQTSSRLDDNYEYNVNLALPKTGSVIVVLGQGKDSTGYDYDFHFINEIDRLSLSGTTVRETDLENIYEFALDNKTIATLNYYADGANGLSEYFELVMNEDIDQEMTLTYSVKLDNPNDFAGLYEDLTASQISYDGIQFEDVLVSYKVPYSYTVEHQYYTCTLDNLEPVEDGKVVEDDPIVTHTSEVTVDDLNDLMNSSPDGEFDKEDQPDIDDSDEEDSDNESDIDDSDDEDSDNETDVDDSDDEDSDNESDIDDPDNPWWDWPWWDWPWLDWPWLPRTSEVRALEPTIKEENNGYGQGHVYCLVDGKEVPLTERYTLDKDPTKNKIIIKYYRTSYTVDHKYFTSVKGGAYTLDGVVTSKEYTGLEGEIVRTQDVHTRVKYKDNLYKLYKYGNDITLQVNPSLNKLTIEYRREVINDREDDVMGGNTPPAVIKPIPPIHDTKPIQLVNPSKVVKPNVDKKEIPDTGDHTNIALYVGLGIVAILGMIVLMKKKK